MIRSVDWYSGKVLSGKDRMRIGWINNLMGNLLRVFVFRNFFVKLCVNPFPREYYEIFFSNGLFPSFFYNALFPTNL